MTDKNNLKKLYSQGKRRLQILKEEQATKGKETPPIILLEIESIREQLNQIEKELNQIEITDNKLILTPIKKSKSESITQITQDKGEDKEEDDTSLHKDYLKALESTRTDIISFVESQIYSLQDINDGLRLQTEKLQEEVFRLRDIIYSDISIGKDEELEEEINHKMSIRKELIKRFRALELEEAKKGIDTPPHIKTQITDIRKRIIEIETKIKLLTYNRNNQNS